MTNQVLQVALLLATWLLYAIGVDHACPWLILIPVVMVLLDAGACHYSRSQSKLRSSRSSI